MRALPFSWMNLLFFLFKVLFAHLKATKLKDFHLEKVKMINIKKNAQNLRNYGKCGEERGMWPCTKKAEKGNFNIG